MSVRVTPLTKVFAAQIDGADLTHPLDDARHKRLLQRTTVSG